MGKSLYRSYRSTSFDEIIGQDHIVTTLLNSLKNDAISHAYLLSGPRGVGKTSVARIMAYSVNNQPYESENTNLDIIEIDAASNRRIDEIREIRERVHIAPTVGKYKVYIIDEVHMLTKEAFNALLKTLEEPPKHVIFILATTEFHKVPETIVSRCIRFTFKPIENKVIADHLKMIAGKEKIDITDKALAVLAEHGRGSFRDAITLLDQVKNTGSKIDEDTVSLMLGLAPSLVIDSIFTACKNQDFKEVLNQVQAAYDSGSHESILCSQLSEKLRSQLISSQEAGDKGWILELLSSLLNVPGSPKPRIALELALITAASRNEINIPDTIQTQQAPVQPIKPKEVTVTKPLPPKPEPITTQELPQNSNTTTTPDEKPIITKTAPEKSPKTETPIENKDTHDENSWKSFLDILKKDNTTLYGVLRMATINHTGGALDIRFKFAFHYKQVSEAKNNAIIVSALQSVYGKDTPFNFGLLEEAASKKSVDVAAGIENVSNIFGGHELLEL